jgi:glutathione S-transferase
MIHCLPTVYNRRIDATMAEKLAPGLEKNVVKDLYWLEAELKVGKGRYLVGDHVTAADTTVAFSVQFILAMRLAPRSSRWAAIEGWLRNVEGGSPERHPKSFTRSLPVHCTLLWS